MKFTTLSLGRSRTLFATICCAVTQNVDFMWHFYEYVSPRPLEEIEREIKELEDDIRGMLEEVLRDG